MKKLLSLSLLALAALTANAQNIQAHYDFGRNLYPDEESTRQKVTVTLEQFKADNWGSWYYFVDIDLSRKETLGAYTEISREFTLTFMSSTMAVSVPVPAATSRQPSPVSPTMATPPVSPPPGRYSCSTSASLRTTTSIRPTTACSSRVSGACISSTVRCRSSASSISGADRKPMGTDSSSSSPSHSCGTISPTTSA